MLNLYRGDIEIQQKRLHASISMGVDMQSRLSIVILLVVALFAVAATPMYFKKCQFDNHAHDVQVKKQRYGDTYELMFGVDGK